MDAHKDELRCVERAIGVIPADELRAPLETELEEARAELQLALARIRLSASKATAPLAAARDRLARLARAAVRASRDAGAGCTEAQRAQVDHHAERLEDLRRRAPPPPGAVQCEACECEIEMTGSMRMFLQTSHGLCFDCAAEAEDEDDMVAATAAPTRRSGDSLQKSLNEHLNNYQALGALSDLDPQPQKLLAIMRQHARALNKRSMTHLTIFDVRKILKTMKRADLYNHAPLLLAELSGHRPPRLGEDTLAHVKARIVEQVRNHMPEGASVNYFYTIYKHLEAVLPPRSPDRAILRFIHLQEQRTLAEQDTRYADYCRATGQKVPPATDRTYAAARYAPK